MGSEVTACEVVRPKNSAEKFAPNSVNLVNFNPSREKSQLEQKQTAEVPRSRHKL